MLPCYSISRSWCRSPLSAFSVAFAFSRWGQRPWWGVGCHHSAYSAATSKAVLMAHSLVLRAAIGSLDELSKALSLPRTESSVFCLGKYDCATLLPCNSSSDALRGPLKVVAAVTRLWASCRSTLKKGIFLASQMIFVTCAVIMLLFQGCWYCPSKDCPAHVACGAWGCIVPRQANLSSTWLFFPVPAMLYAVNIPPTIFKEKSESCLIFHTLIERSRVFSTSYCIISLSGVALI